MDIKEFYATYLQIHEPFEHQKDVWEAVKNGGFPLLIKAPTGSGKTEAIIAPFLEQFITNNFSIAPRLIYVLPMRVLVNSVAERIRKYAQKISPFIQVEIQHGDVPNAPFFIADIVVTTLDQFLYGFARSSHQVGHHLDIPAGSIASSLVVFDEAHMYRDEFTFSIMRALMEILYESKIPFVLMTATMPEGLKNSLFENIHIKSSNIIKGDVVVNSELKISLSDFPLYEQGNVNISQELLEKIKNKKTLIVLNQVKRAQIVYEELKNILELKDDEIVLLHSRFTRADRKEHEEKALSLIPHKKDGKMIIPEGVGIVVSTQVLEAGIDFSAELLLTEIAPADCLVQRAGRCARYEGEKGEMIIFPLENEKKSYKPYEKAHIDITLDWLTKNSKFDIKNFTAACEFVNLLDYKANDFEAADTLIDLYECVLYADTEPKNIQLRDGKPATLVVLPESVMNKKEEIKKFLENNPDYLKEHSLDVDVGVIWKYFKENYIRWEMKWEYDEKENKHKLVVNDILGNERKIDEKDKRVGPFRVYLLYGAYYKKEVGVCPDECFII